MPPFPQGGRAIIEAMKVLFPEFAVNDDPKQRQLTRKINEQFKHTYGDRWCGKKRAGAPDSTQSKDSQAYKETDGSLSVWDLFQGNDDVTILVNDGDDPTHHVPSNEGEPVEVQAINHLHIGEPDPEPENGGEPGPGNGGVPAGDVVVDLLNVIVENGKQQVEELQAIRRDLQSTGKLIIQALATGGIGGLFRMTLTQTAQKKLAIRRTMERREKKTDG